MLKTLNFLAIGYAAHLIIGLITHPRFYESGSAQVIIAFFVVGWLWWFGLSIKSLFKKRRQGDRP